MAGRFVFAPLAGAAVDRPVLEAAQSAAERLDAVVQCAFAEPDAAAYFSGANALGAIPMSALKAVDEAREAGLQKARDTFEAVFGTGEVDTAHFGGGLDRTGLRNMARLAACVTIDADSVRGAGPFAALFEDFLFLELAPILVPRERFDFDHIGLAWNGSRQAANAMRRAMPFLRKARRVSVIQRQEGLKAVDALASDPAMALSWLKARGVAAEQVEATGSSAPASVLDAALDAGCGLLVAGAYGQSRARELVFGGATRHFVKDDHPLSLLLAH